MRSAPTVMILCALASLVHARVALPRRDNRQGWVSNPCCKPTKLAYGLSLFIAYFIPARFTKYRQVFFRIQQTGFKWHRFGRSIGSCDDRPLNVPDCTTQSHWEVRKFKDVKKIHKTEQYQLGRVDEELVIEFKTGATVKFRFYKFSKGRERVKAMKTWHNLFTLAFDKWTKEDLLRRKLEKKQKTPVESSDSSSSSSDSSSSNSDSSSISDSSSTSSDAREPPSGGWGAKVVTAAAIGGGIYYMYQYQSEVCISLWDTVCGWVDYLPGDDWFTNWSL